MDNEVLIAVFGFFSTLLGTLLGWFLNGLSRKGRIRLYVKDFKEIYQKIDGYGGVEECDNIEEAQYYTCEFMLDVYNSSLDNLIMREIRIVYVKNKERLFSSIVKDDKTKTTNVPVYFDDISVVNIPPRGVLRLVLHHSMNNKDDNWSKLFLSSRILLEYVNEKNKKKCIELNKTKNI